MGLVKPLLRLIAREHQRKPFQGDILLLGRQGIHATLKEVKKLLLEEGCLFVNLHEAEGTFTNIPSWRGTFREVNTNDAVFFKLLGLNNVLAMDYSPFENADLTHDLNFPVPDELCNRFGLILDGGTMEHVFDVRQVLVNIVRMLKPGGRVLHLSPCNNYLNHGFYQFSPTLFFDYYQANAFTDIGAYLFNATEHFSEKRPWEIYAIRQPSMPMMEIKPRGLIGVFFYAEKSSQTLGDKIPIQSYYVRTYSDTVTSPASRARSYATMLLPKPLITFLKKYVLIHEPENRLPLWIRVVFSRIIPSRLLSRQNLVIKRLGRVS